MGAKNIRWLPIAAAFLALSVPSSPFAAEAAEGVWVLPDDSARIRIAPCAGNAATLCGTIVSIKPRPAGQARPSPAVPPRDSTAPRRDPQSMVGQVILVGFKANGARDWKGGKVQIPGTDFTVNATLRLQSANALRVNFCVLVVCRNQTWSRAA